VTKINILKAMLANHNQHGSESSTLETDVE